MKIKKAIPTLALVLLAGSAFAVTSAHAKGCPMMASCPMMQGHMQSEAKSTITDAQRKEARMLVEKAQSTISPLKQQLFVKNQELQALQNAATPDVSAVSKKATEIVELQQKLMNEKKALGDAIDKALGLEPGTHNFSGHGGHGTGKGSGHGNHKMGKGSGHGMHKNMDM